MNKNLLIKDLGLYLKNEKTLLIGDLHLGFEESLTKQGILLPKFQLQETIRRLDKILTNLDVEEIVITGDLKHEFGKILTTEMNDTLDFLDHLLKKYKVAIIKGNHDTILSYIAQKRNIELKQYYRINDIFICHGDKLFNNLDFFNSKTLVIGHEHPAVSLINNNRSETFKCFLCGKYKDKEIIVLPSFNVLVDGSDILREQILSPYLRQDISNFDVYIIADTVYKFGKLKNLRRLSSFH